MFEHKSQPLIPARAFAKRLASSAVVALTLVLLSLLAGMIGYHQLEDLGWLDAFLNAAMLLGGMGPVALPVTDAGKLFAGVYALYCGLVVILVAGIVLTPVAHRLMHAVHLEDA
jgi:hypothetical protein